MTVPVGRLAPSPTGLLHVGHARSFLLAWWHVRSRGGRVLLRIEDLDGDRCRPEWVDAARRDLEWLGIDWDGPAHLQSEGLEEIEAALARLEREGRAYACVCSRADVRQAQTAPHAGDRELRYPGTCRGRFASRAEAERETGRPAGLRLSVPAGAVRFEDGFAGPQAFDPAAEVGDFPVARRDGGPAYQLAVVVDDAAMGVTEVLRGSDLLASTARQIHILDALGLPHPRWFHVPLVTDEGGRRLAKRADDVSLAELRGEGVDPRALAAWIARSSGHPTEERIRPADLLPQFRLPAVPAGPVPFGPREKSELV